MSLLLHFFKVRVFFFSVFMCLKNKKLQGDAMIWRGRETKYNLFMVINRVSSVSSLSSNL